ncbi:glutamate-rich protein 1 [Hyperolius riggenbachi]|uniref:glutamate-rich protein 1 n=1 Tax=Hyperolius riggenbachi TaxID=752182 RepID=UPI0035A2850D
MSSARREAILSKVLTRLYPAQKSTSSIVKQPNEQSVNGAHQQGTRETHSEDVQHPGPSSTASDEKLPLPHQKIYTVSHPPKDYAPVPQNDVESSTTESSDEEMEEDHSVVRRRRRRHRNKGKVTPYSSSDHGNDLQQTEHEPVKSERGFINKSKKRKLQRKRQRERLKAAGLWPKKKSVGLKNPPDEELLEPGTVEKSSENTEQEQKKTEDLLDFLQATQEIYFSESKLRCADTTLTIELMLEIMNQIKNGAVPFSEVCLLHRCKILLLLQDIERLKDSLDSFKENSSIPPDHRMALYSLFSYWITNILPIK